ncbi:MAG: DUF5658 family protein [Bryobacteraceae bacterium]
MQLELANEANLVTQTSRRFATRAIRLAVVIFIGLQCLDLFTTWMVFSHGGVELNPIVRALMPWTGMILAVLISKATLVLLILLLNRRIWVLRFANILYTCVVAWNLWILSALQSGA